MLDLFLVSFILLLGLSPFLLQLAQRFGLLPQQSRLQRRLEQRLRRHLADPRLPGSGRVGSGFAGGRRVGRSLNSTSAFLEEQPEEREIEGIGWVIGDLSCQFNSGSPLLRCAINPLGPCAGCHSYEPKADLNS